MIIIGIAGPTASGKTSVAKHLEKRFCAMRTRYSEILATIAVERGLPTDKATLQNIYLTERKTRGEGFLAELLEEKIHAVQATVFVIEGNRRLVDIALLKRVQERHDSELRLIYVDADPEERFLRYNTRQTKQGLDPISREDFQVLEENPAEDELPLLKEMITRDGVVLESDGLSEEDMVHRAVQLLNLSPVVVDTAPMRSS